MLANFLFLQEPLQLGLEVFFLKKKMEDFLIPSFHFLIGLGFLIRLKIVLIFLDFDVFKMFPPSSPKGSHGVPIKFFYGLPKCSTMYGSQEQEINNDIKNITIFV